MAPGYDEREVAELKQMLAIANMIPVTKLAMAEAEEERDVSANTCPGCGAPYSHICSYHAWPASDWPEGMELVRQLREALGLRVPAPITPARAWQEALDEVKRMRLHSLTVEEWDDVPFEGWEGA